LKPEAQAKEILGAASLALFAVAHFNRVAATADRLGRESQGLP
jgi:hypothetical protein